MLLRSIVLIGALMAAVPAFAQETRDLCPDRPGFGTPACTVDAGAAVLEVGLADWTLDQHDDSRTESWVFGDVLLRAGVTPSLEVQLGWTMLGHVREWDRVTHEWMGRTQAGDVTLALRQNLRNPDGSGFSLAVMPYATLPMGGEDVGAAIGERGCSCRSASSSARCRSATPHLDAAVDEDGDGRHLAYGSVVGLGFDLSDDVSAAAELSLTRDRDPGGHTTEALAGVSLAGRPAPTANGILASMPGSTATVYAGALLSAWPPRRPLWKARHRGCFGGRQTGPGGQAG